MTRKDYILIANAIVATQERIKAQHQALLDAPNVEGECLLIDTPAFTNKLAGVRKAAAHLCVALAENNERFDQYRFLKACGYGA